MCIFADAIEERKIVMSTTAVENHSATPVMYYWGMVKDLNDSQKLELVRMLVESLQAVMTSPKKAKRKKLDACNYAGIWSDDEYMDADELVKAIHDARHFKDSTNFWDEL